MYQLEGVSAEEGIPSSYNNKEEIKMEYNNTKTIKSIKLLMRLIHSDAADTEEIKLDMENSQLETLYRCCELMEDYASEARVLIGKMLDGREDVEAEDEGE
jgi:hypothetical protein